MTHKMGRFSRFFLFLSSTVINIVRTETVVPSESPDDIIWKVNESVKPKPLPNLLSMNHRPPELNLDAKTRLSVQLFEGCVTLDANDEHILSPNQRDTLKRRVIMGERKQWKNQRIPYEIVTTGITDLNQEQLSEKVRNVLNQLTSQTCLVFSLKNENDGNWIQFYDGLGCHADLGKKSTPDAPTQISIGKGCESEAVIMHLLLHGLDIDITFLNCYIRNAKVSSVRVPVCKISKDRITHFIYYIPVKGFLHEQNRVDRDTYITIQWENIIPKYQAIFRRRALSSIDIQSGQYNYNSIMHASNRAYGTGVTMIAKHNSEKELGGMTLNQLDIMNIKLYYHCSRFEWNEWGSWSECSRPCGHGYHRRTRVCGGESQHCNGHSSEFRSCRIARCHPAPLDTTFEDDWGEWKPRSSSKCNWRRGRSKSIKQLTGPQVDHTTGTGRFAQVKYSEACQKGVQALMRTNRLPPSPAGRCISFVYYLYGEGVGSLEVQTKELTSVHGTPVWSREDDQGKGWHQAAAFIPPLPFSYQILLVATIGESGVSDISVDDIYVDNGKCPEGLSKCSDAVDQCKQWSMEGECYTNHKWMMLHCCKSCLVIPECLDKDHDCAHRAGDGECSINKREMWSTCCKSCEACLDKDNRCYGWAEQGECDVNAEWMASNCSKSCKICKGIDYLHPPCPGKVLYDYNVCSVILSVLLPCQILTSDDEASGGLLEDSEFGMPDTLQNRASDPRDHTAAGDIEEVNSEVKPRLGNEEVERKFDRNLFLSDQLFEGCLLLDDKDRELLSQPSDSRTEDKKTHITTKEKVWPSNEIPYDSTFNGVREENKDRFERVIKEAIEDLQRKTCLKFRRKEDRDENWIEFFVGSGCYSELGRKWEKGKATFVSLGPSCWKKDIVLHMILHALGFFHEQNRSDRDHFVRVIWRNIADGKSSIFHRHPLYNTEMYHKLRYDFSSIMHCPRNHFSRRRHLYTVQALHNPERVLGGDELSELDIRKLEMMFCKGRETISESDISWTQWSSCSRSCGLGQRFRRTECKGQQCKSAHEEMRACRLQKCISTKLDSNFEIGTGNWPIKEWYPESCQWAIMKSQGKTVDHTSGTGSFLQADVRSSCKTDQSAYLVSDMQVKSNYKRCFNFFYVLSGENVGSLDLYIVYEKGEHMMIWERKGDQGREWKQGAVTLPIIEERFRLKFIFKKGRAGKTTVLLDDVYVDDGECLEGTQRCIDSAKGCKQWAKDGECFINPNFMMRRCCKSCQESKCINQKSSNRCEQKVEYLSSPHCPVDMWVACCASCRDCLDWHPMCETWAKSGECDNNPPWMKANCRQSCGVCMKLADRKQNR